jgi:hypothetical protein
MHMRCPEDSQILKLELELVTTSTWGVAIAGLRQMAVLLGHHGAGGKVPLVLLPTAMLAAGI